MLNFEKNSRKHLKIGYIDEKEYVIKSLVPIQKYLARFVDHDHHESP